MTDLAHQSGWPSSKHALVRDAILSMLEELDVGDALPSERRLAASLGVSRPTLRAVIDELVREGLLLRRHGSGTYVAEPKIAVSTRPGIATFTRTPWRRASSRSDVESPTTACFVAA